MNINYIFIGFCFSENMDIQCGTLQFEGSDNEWCIDDKILLHSNNIFLLKQQTTR